MRRHRRRTRPCLANQRNRTRGEQKPRGLMPIGTYSRQRAHPKDGNDRAPPSREVQHNAQILTEFVPASCPTKMATIASFRTNRTSFRLTKKLVKSIAVSPRARSGADSQEP